VNKPDPLADASNGEQAIALSECLERALDDYLERHPGTRPDAIEEALDELRWFYVDLQREEGKEDSAEAG
jgi:hypothetical protein